MQINNFSMQKVSTKWVDTDSSKFWTLAGTENSTEWYSQYHGQVTSLPLSGSEDIWEFHNVIISEYGECQLWKIICHNNLLVQQLERG